MLMYESWEANFVTWSLGLQLLALNSASFLTQHACYIALQPFHEKPKYWQKSFIDIWTALLSPQVTLTNLGKYYCVPDAWGCLHCFGGKDQLQWKCRRVEIGDLLLCPGSGSSPRSELSALQEPRTGEGDLPRASLWLATRLSSPLMRCGSGKVYV